MASDRVDGYKPVEGWERLHFLEDLNGNVYFDVGRTRVVEKSESVEYTEALTVSGPAYGFGIRVVISDIVPVRPLEVDGVQLPFRFYWSVSCKAKKDEETRMLPATLITNHNPQNQLKLFEL